MNNLKHCLKSGKNIGICSSISAPYRLKVDISSIPIAAGFICKLIEDAKKAENLSKYRVTIPEFSLKSYLDFPEMQTITLRSNGESNHSGSTPMNCRKDAVYGVAKLIELLSEESDIQFVETNTPTWGPNQINSSCEVSFAIPENASPDIKQRIFEAQEQASQTANVKFEKINNITERDNESGLFIDIRQQLGLNPKLSSDIIFETITDIVNRTKCKAQMNITAKGDPYITNKDLIQNAVQICRNQQIPYEILPSWPGHDLATLTHNEDARTLLLFCDSSGGSHNVNETTTIDSINKLVTVESSLAQNEIARANKIYGQCTQRNLEEIQDNIYE